MKSFFARRALVFVALALVLAVGVAATAFDMDELRARWSSLSADEKDVMRERFERYQAMGETERAALAEKSRRIDLLARRMYRGLSDSERARFDDLGPKQRRELLREMAVDHARDIGERIQAKLPAHAMARLESASADDWVDFLEEFKRRQRLRMDQVLSNLGQELELDESEVRRLRNLDDDERGRKFLELMQRRSQRAVADLPPGLARERWAEIQQLPPDDFFEAIMELREAYPGFGRPPGSPLPPPRIGADDAEGEAVERTPVPPELALTLNRVLHPSLEERLDLVDLDAAHRGVEISKRRRGRILRLFEESGVLPDVERRRLTILPDGRFFHRVRSLLRHGIPVHGEEPETPE